MRRYVLVAALTVALGFGGTPAAAIVINPVDFDGLLSPGAMHTDSWTTQFMTPDLTGQGGPASYSIGSLQGTVWDHNTNGMDTYIYQLVVDPQVNPSEFNTGFAIQGFTGRAGWDFPQAVAFGASDDGSMAFVINWEDDGSLDFNKRRAEHLNGFWGGMDPGPLTFFFESSSPPVNGNFYNLMSSEVGSAENWVPAAPVPEPSSLLLLGSGLVGLGLWARWKFKDKRPRSAEGLTVRAKLAGA